ncbi:hypothetical protein [Nostoc sp.]|uniref:hypothetical protein n=1 Tax=Nostoc sp. TaxID=1180 RepID=UPI0035944434
MVNRTKSVINAVLAVENLDVTPLWQPKSEPKFQVIGRNQLHNVIAIARNDCK